MYLRAMTAQQCRARKGELVPASCAMLDGSYELVRYCYGASSRTGSHPVCSAGACECTWMWVLFSHVCGVFIGESYSKSLLIG